MFGQGGSRDDINKLIRFYFDAKEDFRLAASRSPDPAWRDELQGLCDRREQFHLQLQDEVTRHGVEMSDNGTAKADLKRDWERLRGPLAGHKFEAALKLADKSECHAAETAEALLARDLPPTIRMMIERHFGEIRQARARIAEMLAHEPVHQ
ncbi:MAG: PA2169 family four-helix-bundle protein [Tepidisphaeraceae bacterium]